MAYLGKARKEDLKRLAEEMGIETNSNEIVFTLKEKILQSENYDEEFCKELLQSIIADRLEENERAREERESERAREERERAREEREKERERQFELEKLRIEAENKSRQPDSYFEVSDSNRNNYDLQKIMHKFNNKEDISLYLLLFERQARRINIEESEWVTYLLGLLPYDIVQLIIREPEEIASNYSHVKALLLKRFKLSPEKFKQKFMQHSKSTYCTWRDFSYELSNFFDEWITGLSITSFQELKSLMITEQLKKKVPIEIRLHFFQEWTKINTPDLLSDKIDEFESLELYMKPSPKYTANCEFSKNQTQAEYKICTEDNQPHHDNSQVELKPNPFPFYPNTNDTNTRHKEISKPKCYNCNEYGHISKYCLKPKVFLGKNDVNYCNNIQNDFPENEEQLSSNMISLNKNISNSVKSSPYLKRAKINDNGNVSSFVDTGSSSCFMKESVAKKLNLNVTPTFCKIYSIGRQINSTTKTVGKCKASVKLDNVTCKDITIFIIKDFASPVDLIIGRSFINQPHIGYFKSGASLCFEYSNNKSFQEIFKKFSGREYLISTENR